MLKLSNIEQCAFRARAKTTGSDGRYRNSSRSPVTQASYSSGRTAKTSYHPSRAAVYCTYHARARRVGGVAKTKCQGAERGRATGVAGIAFTRFRVAASRRGRRVANPRTGAATHSKAICAGVTIKGAVGCDAVFVSCRLRKRTPRGKNARCKVVTVEACPCVPWKGAMKEISYRGGSHLLRVLIQIERRSDGIDGGLVRSTKGAADRARSHCHQSRMSHPPNG
ncbi:hypothetical protein VTI74DRAFT_4023 [Chaetomium olivicolor]